VVTERNLEGCAPSFPAVSPVQAKERNALTRQGEASPIGLANALVDAALQHAAAPLSDDVAVVILRVLEPRAQEPHATNGTPDPTHVSLVPSNSE